MQKLSCQQLTSSILSLQTKQRDFDDLIRPEIKNILSARELQDSIRKELDEVLNVISPFEKLSREEVKKQYLSQVEILRTAGVIEQLSSGKEGIIGIDGKEYEIPGIEVIINQMIEKKEFFAKKIEQGFGKLLLIPFAKSLDSLIELTKERLLAHKKAGKLLNADGIILSMNEAFPLCIDVIYQNSDQSGQLIYYPEEFSSEPKGKTKLEMLSEESQTPGWQIQLVEDMPNIPKDGKGKMFAGRPQLEAGKSPREYLKTQKENPIYKDEVFFIPESWLSYLITHLEETNQVIDDLNGLGCARLLASSYFGTPNTPYACWSRNIEQAHLGSIQASDTNSSTGVGCAVRIT